MSALVRHFGDVEDGKRRCGICDFCSPDRTVAQTTRAITSEEREAVQAVLSTLRFSITKSTGKLHKELFPNEQMSRRFRGPAAGDGSAWTVGVGGCGI